MGSLSQIIIFRMNDYEVKEEILEKMIFMNIMFMLVIVSVFTVIRFASSIRQEKKKNVRNMMEQIAVSNSNQLETMFDELDRVYI